MKLNIDACGHLYNVEDDVLHTVYIRLAELNTNESIK